MISDKSQAIVSRSCILQYALLLPIHSRPLYPLFNLRLACRLMGKDEQHAASGHVDSSYLSNVQRPISVLGFIYIPSNVHQPIVYLRFVCNLQRKSSTQIIYDIHTTLDLLHPTENINAALRPRHEGNLSRPVRAFLFRILDRKELMHLHRLKIT